jgi:hypothetical protein
LIAAGNALAASTTVDTAYYDTENMIPLEINLEVASTAVTGTLAYPISITLPIPSSINAADLRILHISADGTVEVIVPTDNGDGTCTFIITHFSTFAFVEALAEPIEPGDNTGNNPGISIGSSSGSSSGSSGSGGGGSTSTTTAPTPVTKTNAVNLTKKAITEATASGTSAVVKFKNVSTLSLANIKAMLEAAGTTPITIQADSMAQTGKAVDVRISFDPTKSTQDLNLSASTWNTRAVKTKKVFQTYFSNPIMVASLGQQGTFGQAVKLAVKLDATLKTDNLYFYSYDKATNIYKRILPGEYRIDAKGYVHFTTTQAGDIIISEGALAKK